MKKLSLDNFNQLMTDSSIKPRLKKELRFVTSTENISDEEWHDRETLNITDRNGNKGVLLIELDENLYIAPYELKTGIISSTTGKSQAVICDLCKSWQSGSRSGSITFAIDRTTNVSYLCCEDLKCSLHIRNQTNAGHISRTQLREDLSIEQRIDRFKSRLQMIVTKLDLTPVTLR